MNRTLVLLTTTALAACAMAQQSGTKPADAQETKLFASAQQSAEMKKLVDNFAGNWRTTISTHKPWFPQDAATKGRADISAGPAGNSMHENFRSIGSLGNFAGRGI